MQYFKSLFFFIYVLFYSLHDHYPYLEHDQQAQSWTLEEGYASGTPIETYPHRGAVSV